MSHHDVVMGMSLGDQVVVRDLEEGPTAAGSYPAPFAHVLVA
jgi:hypothetical protein